MNILIPMAGAGSRFTSAGYKLHKPVIPVTSRHNGHQIPMVVAATQDLPEINNPQNKIIYIDRDFHKKNGIEDKIKKFFPTANFITIDYLTSGQASTCLLAKNYINNDEELLIAGCDNGMVFDQKKFLIAKESAEILIFTFRGNEAVLENPQGYGWVEVDKDDNVRCVSVKSSISNNPLYDHAIVSSFWFKHGYDFINAAEEMIAANDRINNEFYVDQIIKYCLQHKKKIKVFEINKYLCWGTAQEYENYEKTINYWHQFYRTEFITNISENKRPMQINKLCN